MLLGMKRILVAVDGSEPAAHALQWAIAMARGVGAEVIAVFAIAPFQDLSLGTAGPLVPPQADPGGAPPAPSNMPDMHTRGPTAGRTTKSVLPWLPSTLPSKPLPQPVSGPSISGSAPTASTFESRLQASRGRRPRQRTDGPKQRGAYDPRQWPHGHLR